MNQRPDFAPETGPDTAQTAGPATAATVDPASVLVGIPALDEARHIEATLRSLTDGSPEMRQVRIVVADGGSTDGTQALVRAMQATLPNLELVDNPDRLQSAALNLVVDRCATDRHAVLVRCDAHASYPPGFVLRVAESLVAHDAASVVVPMDAVGDGCFARAAAWAVDTPLGSGGAAHRGGRASGPVDHGHHAGFRLDWFRRVGGYDPSFSHNEDAEYDHRLGLAGGLVWLDATIRLDYHMRPTLGRLARQYWNYGRGRARTLQKHRMRPRLRQMVPVLAVLAIAGALLLSLAWRPFGLVPAAYLLLLAATSLAIAVRHRSLCGLWAGPAIGAMHLPWGAGFLRQVLGRGARP